MNTSHNLVGGTDLTNVDHRALNHTVLSSPDKLVASIRSTKQVFSKPLVEPSLEHQRKKVKSKNALEKPPRG